MPRLDQEDLKLPDETDLDRLEGLYIREKARTKKLQRRVEELESFCNLMPRGIETVARENKRLKEILIALHGVKLCRDWEKYRDDPIDDE